jgi:hypothetical protein
MPDSAALSPLLRRPRPLMFKVGLVRTESCFSQPAAHTWSQSAMKSGIHVLYISSSRLAGSNSRLGGSLRSIHPTTLGASSTGTACHLPGRAAAC